MGSMEKLRPQPSLELSGLSYHSGMNRFEISLLVGGSCQHAFAASTRQPFRTFVNVLNGFLGGEHGEENHWEPSNSELLKFNATHEQNTLQIHSNLSFFVGVLGAGALLEAPGRLSYGSII